MDKTATAPILYDHTGKPIFRAPSQTPDFDPTFLLSFAQQWSNSGQLLKQALERPYQYYIWVYACAAAIASNVCRLTPYLYSDKEKNKPIFNHPVLKLFSRPNPFMTGSQFMEAIVLNLLLPTERTSGGQCFLFPGDDKGAKPTNFYKGDIPRELYPFSDTYVFPIVLGGALARWELRLPNSPIVSFSPDETIRIHLYNPYSLLMGMSPYSAATYAVEADIEANELSKNFSKNQANVGGMLTTEKALNKDQANDLRTEWDTRHGSVAKAGRTAILHSGLTYEATSKSLADLQYIDGRKLNREEVLAAYRVPQWVLGLSAETNYATAIAAKKSFWEDTLIPMLDRVWEPINSQWIQYISPGDLKGYSDLSQVEALRADLTAKVAIADTLIRQGTPAAEAYRILDIPVDGQKYPWLEQSLVIGSRTNLETGEVIGGFSIEVAPSAPDKDEETTPVGEGEGAKALPKPKVGGPNLRTIERVRAIEYKADARDKFWLSWVKRTLNPGEKKMQSMLIKYFIAQRNAALDAVDEWAASAPSGKSARLLLREAPTLPKITLSLAEWNAVLKKLAYPIYDAGIEVQAAQMEDELGDLINWKQNSPYVEQYKRERFSYMKNINTTNFNLAEAQIKKVIDESIANNLTTAETSGLLKDSLNQVYGTRLHTTPFIARTEMGSIASTTRFSIMEEEGIEENEWLSARDENVRETHQQEDGHVVKVGERFPSTGLLHPGENGGEPGEVINCRCTILPKERTDV